MGIALRWLSIGVGVALFTGLVVAVGAMMGTGRATHRARDAV